MFASQSNLILAIIWAHFVADFVLQSDRMAINKSSNAGWLSIHVMVYSLFMCVFGVKYAAINGALHWATDFVSSRATSYLWKKEKRHWFFVVIGLDQAIHMSCLIYTMGVMK